MNSWSRAEALKVELPNPSTLGPAEFCRQVEDVNSRHAAESTAQEQPWMLHVSDADFSSTTILVTCSARKTLRTGRAAGRIGDDGGSSRGFG